MDAIATPFVQGRLRETSLTVKIESECGHCGRPIELAVSSEPKRLPLEGGPESPLVFRPDVDWAAFSDQSIINAF